MFMQITAAADDKLCTALAKAKHLSPEIIGLLHSAYHDGHHIPDGKERVAERIKDARRHIEAMMVAILAAEQAISPAPLSAPALDRLEPFPGNGAYTL